MPASRMPRAESPAAAGVSQKSLADMMRGVLDEGLELHSVMVVRHGQVAYADTRAPYGPRDPHALFSVSKSIASLAVGFAVAEGLFRLEDTVAGLLHELRGYAPGDELLALLTVEHLIAMRAGKVTSILTDRTKKQWVRDFVLSEWGHAPGEGWRYCSENTYLACAVIRRVTGESVTDFLMPRLFEPLGIERPYWEHDGRGVEAGGWGLYLTTEDLAKIAYCCACGGVYEGRQVIPAAWAQAACQKQSETASDEYGGMAANGYGYGFWMNELPGSCRMDGMFSQFALIFPEYDACLVTTGGEIDMQAVYTAVMRHVPALFTGVYDGETREIPRLPAYAPLEEAPRNPAMERRLQGRCLRFPPGARQLGKAMGIPMSMMPAAVFFMSADKAGGIDRVHLRFSAEGLKFSWSEGPERNTVLCGMDGRARKCKITLGGVPFTLACSAAWDGNELLLRLRCLNSIGERRLRLRFQGRAVRMIPGSEPALRTVIGGDAESFIKSTVPNELLAKLINAALDKIILIAEPVHVGIIR
ncbi:MAG: beta-lactamase family protein [Oscillospiraceae bacterium]|nr:beta-lactamase family protein [Oscillospiraceae bacterium]